MAEISRAVESTSRRIERENPTWNDSVFGVSCDTETRPEDRPLFTLKITLRSVERGSLAWKHDADASESSNGHDESFEKSEDHVRPRAGKLWRFPYRITENLWSENSRADGSDGTFFHFI
jgi:hypothetical protein